MSGSVVIAGQDASGNLYPAAADGDTLAISTNGFRPTYAYRAADFSPVAAATDVLVLTGAANKVIRVTKVGVTGSATAAALVDLYVTKRTTANSGGTSTNPTATKYDSNDSAPSATLTLYTANASSLGTGTGLEGDIVYLPASAAPAGEPSHWERFYGINGTKYPTLRSASESISINFGGATQPSGSRYYLYIEWTEDVA